MAKNKTGKGVGARDTGGMPKSELREYHKEICEFYEANGWRATLSQYLLSPSQAGEITEKTRAKMNKEAAKAKEAKAQARAAKKGAKAKTKSTSKKKVKTAKTTKKKAPLKPGKKTTKKKAAKKAKAPKKAAKGKGEKKASAAPPAVNIEPGSEAVVLDYLLAYRASAATGVSLDTAIADLASRVRWT